MTRSSDSSKTLSIAERLAHRPDARRRRRDHRVDTRRRSRRTGGRAVEPRARSRCSGASARNRSAARETRPRDRAARASRPLRAQPGEQRVADAGDEEGDAHLVSPFAVTAARRRSRRTRCPARAQARSHSLRRGRPRRDRLRRRADRAARASSGRTSVSYASSRMRWPPRTSPSSCASASRSSSTSNAFAYAVWMFITDWIMASILPSTLCDWSIMNATFSRAGASRSRA